MKLELLLHLPEERELELKVKYDIKKTVVLWQLKSSWNNEIEEEEEEEEEEKEEDKEDD